MTADAANEPTPWRRILLVWLGISVLLLAINWRSIAESRFLDPDDMLRLVQVRDLIGGQGWFDLHQYRIDPAASPVMHWSRIVDVPIALAILLLRPLLGPELGDHVAVVLVPLFTLLMLMAVAGRMAFRLFDREVATFACLSIGFSPLLLMQLQPLRIDHHGWQIVCFLAATSALMHRDPRRGGALAGMAVAIGLSISLEVLPLAAIIGAVLLLRWLRDPAQRWWLPSFLLTLAGTIAALFVATRGLGDLSAHCDVASPVHIAFFGIVAVASAAIAAIPRLPRWAILALLGAAGLGGIALFAQVAPQCLGGPFGNLDPVVRQYWYNNVLEGRPIWVQPAAFAFAPALQGIIAVAAVFQLWRTSQGERRVWWFDYLLLIAGTFCLGLLVWRSMAFVGALAAVPVGWLLARLLATFRTADRPARRMGAAFAGLIVLMPTSPVAMAATLMPNLVGGAAALRESGCKLRQSADALDTLPRATIFAPIDIGPGLLLRSHHSVVATGHHRAQLAIRDVILAFTSPEAQAHAIVQRHRARYLVMCSDLAEAQIYADAAPHGLMAQLLKGKPPAWLEEVPLGTPASFRVWKVAD